MAITLVVWHEKIRELIGQILNEILAHFVEVFELSVREVVVEPLACVNA